MQGLVSVAEAAARKRASAANEGALNEKHHSGPAAPDVEASRASKGRASRQDRYGRDVFDVGSSGEFVDVEIYGVPAVSPDRFLRAPSATQGQHGRRDVAGLKNEDVARKKLVLDNFPLSDHSEKAGDTADSIERSLLERTDQLSHEAIPSQQSREVGKTSRKRMAANEMLEVESLSEGSEPTAVSLYFRDDEMFDSS